MPLYVRLFTLEFFFLSLSFYRGERERGEENLSPDVFATVH